MSNASGTLAMTKTGSGVGTLAGTNSYSGSTVVRQGTLSLSGGAKTGGGGYYVVDNNAVSTTSAILNISSSVTAYQIWLSDRAGSSQAGALYQTAGDLVLTQGAGVDNLRVGSVASGRGYYKLSGGSLTVNEMGIGGSLSGTIGVMDMTGGIITNNGYLVIGRGNATSAGLLNVTGGTVLFGYSLGNGPLDLGFGDSSGALAVLNVGGGTGVATVTGVSSTTATSTYAGKGLNLASANTAGTLSVVNLLTNGTLTVSDVTSANANPTALLNFNGGTLKATVPNNLGSSFLTEREHRWGLCQGQWWHG